MTFFSPPKNLNPYTELYDSYFCEKNKLFYQSIAKKLAHSASLFCPVPAETPPTKSFSSCDLGCGVGFSSEIFIQNFPRFKWSFIDASAEMLKILKTINAPLLRTLTHKPLVQEAYAENLPFEDCSMDFIFSNLSFHWFSLSSALTEAHRVLKPNGMLFLTYPALVKSSQESGNLILKKLLLKRRKKISRLQTQGLNEITRFTFDSKDFSMIKSTEWGFTENFNDPLDFLNTLYSRGSLVAIFGSETKSKTEKQELDHIFSECLKECQIENSPLSLQWRFFFMALKRN